MIFNFCIGNHVASTAPHHIADMVRLVKFGIESNGHDVLINYHLISRKNVVNIVLDNIDEAFFLKLQDLIHQGGCFILIGTEYVGDNTFNDFLKDGEYGNAENWASRYNYCRQAIQMSTACWITADWQVSEYKKAFDFDNVIYMPFGYHKGFERIVHKKEKDIDIIFTGASTPYRTEVLQTLAGQGLTVYSESVKIPDYLREELLGRAKLAVNIRQSENFPYPSGGRFLYHIINASPLLTEQALQPCDLDSYVLHAQPGEHFINKAIELVNSDLAPIAEENRERLKRERPLDVLFAELLEKTFKHCRL